VAPRLAASFLSQLLYFTFPTHAIFPAMPNTRGNKHKAKVVISPNEAHALDSDEPNI
jgi:hypothetical protein